MTQPVMQQATMTSAMMTSMRKCGGTTAPCGVTMTPAGLRNGWNLTRTLVHGKQLALADRGTPSMNDFPLPDS